MKFSEYIKQLNGYAPNNIVSINYKNKSFLYKNEANCDDCAEHVEHADYDNLNVTGDGFIKIKEYLDWNVVGVEVFLSDNDEKSNCFVLEILKMKHTAELKRKEKAKQDLEEYNELWDKHQREQWLELFLCAVGFLLIIGISWSLGQ